MFGLSKVFTASEYFRISWPLSESCSILCVLVALSYDPQAQTVTRAFLSIRCYQITSDCPFSLSAASDSIISHVSTIYGAMGIKTR